MSLLTGRGLPTLGASDEAGERYPLPVERGCGSYGKQTPRLIIVGRRPPSGMISESCQAHLIYKSLGKRFFSNKYRLFGQDNTVAI
jgi:hypothetical protein